MRSLGAGGTVVGILEKMPLAHGILTVLIEKDFECLDPRLDQSQVNRFPNPKAEA